jgi:hypothetical protein
MFVVAGVEGFTTTQRSNTTTVTPGEEIDLQVTIQNAAPDSDSVALEVDLPPDWTLLDQSASPGPIAFQSSNNQWLWIATNPGGTTFTVNYTVVVPQNASVGEYTVEAKGNYNNGTAVWNNATTNILLEDPTPTPTPTPTATPTLSDTLTPNSTDTFTPTPMNPPPHTVTSTPTRIPSDTRTQTTPTATERVGSPTGPSPTRTQSETPTTAYQFGVVGALLLLVVLRQLIKRRD